MNIDIDEKNKRNKDSGDIELPEWAGRVVRYLYLGAGLFLLASSLTLLGCSSAGAATGLDWQDATSILSEERAQVIVEENSSTSGEELDSIVDSMKVFESDEGLLFVDFNSSLLSGRLGSLYVIYDENENIIFNRYLSKQLPEGIPVLEISTRQSGGYSCLLVNLLENSEVTQSTLCYEGQGTEWIVVNTVILD